VLAFYLAEIGQSYQMNDINAPTDVKQSTTLSLTVDVTADSEAFAEGMAYNLFVFVDGLKAGPLPGTPLTQTGTLQAVPWITASSTIPFR
jgi:hypothetical protein